jgi:hypothetical protein
MTRSESRLQPAGHPRSAGVSTNATRISSFIPQGCMRIAQRFSACHYPQLREVEISLRCNQIAPNPGRGGLFIGRRTNDILFCLSAARRVAGTCFPPHRAAPLKDKSRSLGIHDYKQAAPIGVKPSFNVTLMVVHLGPSVSFRNLRPTCSNDKRFSVGIDGRSWKVPKGRLKNAARVQPSLRDSASVYPIYPTLKRWAIVECPSGTESTNQRKVPSNGIPISGFKSWWH